MKSLLLIRHAKSSWDDLSIPDTERPLNERGKKDAPDMAERLLKRKVNPDAFISSPAKRARKTAEAFAKTYGEGKKAVLLKEQLYGAGDSEFADLISSLPEEYSTVAIFSHNPGITEFANTLTSTRVDNIPTAGIFAVQAEIDNWKEFPTAKWIFWFFDFPKNETD